MVATDETALGNGVIVSAVKTGFGHTLNTVPDMTSACFVQCTYSNTPIEVEPERFRWKGTNAASVTFKQLDSEAAEVWNIIVEYEIYVRE